MHLSGSTKRNHAFSHEMNFYTNAKSHSEFVGGIGGIHLVCVCICVWLRISIWDWGLRFLLVCVCVWEGGSPIALKLGCITKFDMLS